MKVDRKTQDTIVAGLRDMGIDADVDPPYEAPIPVQSRTIRFGEIDEGRFPYELVIDDGGVTVLDLIRNPGEPVAMASFDEADPITCLALCIEVANIDQYLDDQDESLEGRCGTCDVLVDNFDRDHRVTSVLRGGRGVECVKRKDITRSQAGPLRRIGYPT